MENRAIIQKRFIGASSDSGNRLGIQAVDRFQKLSLRAAQPVPLAKLTVSMAMHGQKLEKLGITTYSKESKQ